MQFAPFASDIELPFYTSLASLKINHDKLDDSARKVLGLYDLKPAPAQGMKMQILGSALTTNEVSNGHYRAEGTIKNMNTIEDYKNMDKAGILNRAGRTIWDSIVDGSIYSCPSLLSSFTIISYADLKKYKFTYWFGFPALHSDPSWKNDNAEKETKVGRLGNEETSALVDEVQTWRYRVDSRQHGFFLAKRVRKPHRKRASLDEQRSPVRKSAVEKGSERSEVRSPDSTLNFEWRIGSLADFEEGFFQHVEQKDQYVAFADPSNFAEHPGWMLRNLLVLIQRRWKLKKVQVLCYRDTHAQRDVARSIVLNLSTDQPAAPTVSSQQGLEGKMSELKVDDMPKVTGWERNKDGRLASRMANLGEYLDPTRLADQSVDLNLKLMKWRIAPSLDLDKIKDARCLLLGAGTLGSYVARNLLGWGVRKITFVDNGTISYSNPVRQPLYSFNDCIGGATKKALRAAAALKEIYPGVESDGHVLSVPMAGHPVTDEKQQRADFEKLEELIKEHDVIFLLMDTRESRWLPTVMGKSLGKIVMNAALGFDTCVVMRQGVDVAEGKRGEELGCYFCNDVVAPADSMKDQTLDQQCTVTRPGIAAIASAMLVELLVSILQHPLGPAAPAPTPTSSSTTTQTPSTASNPLHSSSTPPEEPEPTHPLGLLPHQLRIFLSTFQTLPIAGRAYDHCSACSRAMVEAYRSGGWEGFVRKAMDERGFVEKVSGLDEVQKRAEEVLGDVEWDEEDEGEGEML